ncbi:MAG: transposase [Victivallales bacterium]|nr:transposase [Victivallales bacterium]
MVNLLNKDLKVKLSCFKNLTQMVLFRNIDESMGNLSKAQVRFMDCYALVSGNVRGLASRASLTGRPMANRERILKLFFLKAFLNIPTTKAARGFILSSCSWRRICGFESTGEVPSEATLSRAFADFSRDNAIASIHKGILREYVKDTKKLVLNVNYDSTEIAAREKGARKEGKTDGQAQPPQGIRGRRGREDRRNSPPPEPSNLELQGARALDENLAAVPRGCDWGRKTNSKGKAEQWRGYKLHIGAADSGIVTAAMLSSASMHDSQAVIPLMQMNKANTFASLYNVMDAAYDAKAIADFSASLGQVAIIDPNRRNGRARELEPARKVHYKCRTAVERVNSELKESHGARSVMVRGAAKVFTHLMFGVVMVTARHLLELLC